MNKKLFCIGLIIASAVIILTLSLLNATGCIPAKNGAYRWWGANNYGYHASNGEVYSSSCERLPGTPQEFSGYTLEVDDNKYLIIIMKSEISVTLMPKNKLN